MRSLPRARVWSRSESYDPTNCMPWWFSGSVVPSSLRPHALQPASSSAHGKNTGVGTEHLSGLQFPSLEYFPIQGSTLCLLLDRQIVYHWATWEVQRSQNQNKTLIEYLLETRYWGRREVHYELNRIYRLESGRVAHKCSQITVSKGKRWSTHKVFIPGKEAFYWLRLPEEVSREKLLGLSPDGQARFKNGQ